jgi:ribosomal protein S18 acetylase RimI-like enzyme
MSAMTIRPARSDDVPQVLPMVQRLADLHESWDPQRFAYIASVGQRYDGWLRGRVRDERSVFLVAERDADATDPASRVVGFLVATTEPEIPVYRVREIGFIHDLFVDKRYRNEGIARQLVMMAVEAFKRIGVPQVRLETATGNDAARAVFGSCGFRPSSVEMTLELEQV